MIGESVRKDDASLLEKLIKSKSLKDDKYCHLIQGKALYFFYLDIGGHTIDSENFSLKNQLT